MSDSKRKPPIISNDGSTIADNGFLKYITKRDHKTSANSEIGDGDNDHNILNNTLLIVGISGGLLATNEYVPMCYYRLRLTHCIVHQTLNCGVRD